MSNTASSNSLQVRRLTYAALCLALAIVLPFLTGQIPEIGSALCPMHIPVLLCGFLCGWPWGLAVGFVAPLLRSVLFGMPPMFPGAVAMAFELAVYGGVSGFLYRKFPKTIPGYLEKCEELLNCDQVDVPESFRLTARRFMYYQFFHTALSFEPFLQPDETWKGYVKIEKFPLEALDPENDINLKVIHEGILEGKAFVLPDEQKNKK